MTIIQHNTKHPPFNDPIGTIMKKYDKKTGRGNIGIVSILIQGFSPAAHFFMQGSFSSPQSMPLPAPSKIREIYNRAAVSSRETENTSFNESNSIIKKAF